MESNSDIILTNISQASDWFALLPEIMLVLTGVILTLLGAFKRKALRMVSAFAIFAFFANLVFTMWFSNIHHETAFWGMLTPANYTWMFLICGLFSAIMGFRYLSKNPVFHAGEFYGILAIAVAALSIFSRSVHLILTFVALETSAICFYALIAWSRKQVTSLESALRYLILSGVSGAFLALGIAFVYGTGLANNIDSLYFSNFANMGSAMFWIGLILILSAIFFKLSAFPFQFWAPDVYQGAPTPVTAFMATASKLAAAFVFYSILKSLPIIPQIVNIFAVIAVLGIIIGNLGGLLEKNTKRIMGFSGIANAGYLMVLFTFIASANSSVDTAFELSILNFYLFAYMLGSYAVFFVQNLYYKEDDSFVTVDDYKGLWRKSPVAASTLSVGLASLAGIPPSAGFFAKLFVIILAFATQKYLLATIMTSVLIVGSASSIYYYFKWIRAAFEDSDEPSKFAQPESTAPLMIVIALAILSLGVYFFAFWQY